MLLKSSHIIPIEGPNLSPGYICVRDGMICAIGDEFILHMREKEEELIDLGEMVLLPGFVNAHCHLELTAIGPIPPSPSPPPLNGGGISKIPSPLRGEGRGEGVHPNFVAWIKELVSRKNALSENDKTGGIRRGIEKLLRSGVTCVGDHISFNTPWEKIVNSPLRGVLFGEVLGIIPEVCEDIYATFKNIQKTLALQTTRFTLHPSPHSVHAVHPLILKKVLADELPPLSCHLAESKAEEEYFQTEKGALARFIRERKHDVRHPGASAIDFLKKENLPISKLLVVHGNYLTAEGLKSIAENRLSLVHCPGSHEYFGHKPFPLDKYLADGINVAVGTDSIASNTDLDFLLELKRIKKSFPNLETLKILQMAAINGARALRMDAEIGSLVAGKKADIIGFRLDGNKNPDKAPLMADHVDWMMINGQITISPCGGIAEFSGRLSQ